MEENILKIKCSYCGAVLAVKRLSGIESKALTCPICNSKAPFSSYKILVKTDDPTRYSGRDCRTDDEDGCMQYGVGADDTQYAGFCQSGQGDRKTVHNFDLNWTLGKLTVEETGQGYQLKPGRNVVGRKAQSSSADFQIAVADNKRISREHLAIEVKKVPGKGFVHQVSLFKEQCNRTLVEHETLVYGDCLVLNHGDRIRLPGMTLKFEIPDEEGTEI